MKQTSEQFFNNLPEEPEVTFASAYCPPTYSCSGFYCPPTPAKQIPKGYYECPNCVGTGEIEVEYYDDGDMDEYWEKEICDTCKGKGYITLKKLNKWKKETDNAEKEN